MRSSILNKILLDWRESVKSGVPDTTDATHLSKLFEILGQHGWPGEARMEFIGNIVEQKKKTIDPETPVKYTIKDKDGKDIQKTTTYGQAIKRHTDSPAFKAADALRQKGAGEEPEKPRKGLEPSDFERDFDKEKPEKETTSQRDKRRVAYNKQTDEKIKNSDNPSQTASELISDRRDNIRKASDLPAGTPASTTGETYGGIALEQLTVNPDMTEDEFVENELEKIKGTPLYDILIEKAKSSKQFKKNPDKYVNQWLSVGFKTGKGELDYLKSEEKFNYKKPQSKPYPMCTTMDYNQKQIVQSLLEQKMGEHELGSSEYEHYQKQLDYLEKLDDTDTGTLYKTNDGVVGFKHTSNKKGWTDPHSNTSVRKKGEKISKAVDGNESLSDNDRKRVVETTNNAVESAATTVDNAEKVVSQDSQNLSDEAVENVGKIFEFFEPRRIDYVQEMRTLPVMKKHLQSRGIDSENATEQELAESVIEMVKDGTATQDIQKMILKTSDVVARVRELNKKGLKQYGGHMSVQQIAEHLNISSTVVKTCLDSSLDDIEDTSRKRKDSMAVAHEQLVGDLQKADSEMDSDSYPNNSDGDNGPNQRAYVQSFLDEIHFTRYVNGELEGIQSINIGGTSVSPTELRECIAELSGFDGDLDSTGGRKELMNHLQRRLRVSPVDDSVSFGSEETGEIKELGKENYRTKGKSKSILAHLGKDMIGCLKSKN
jgi:hypothetical protein